MRPRTATSDDITALIALIESAYRGDASRSGWTTEADLLGGQRIDAAMLAETIADPGQCLLLFEEAGQLVACVNCERREDYGYIGLVTVRPTAQGGGWGARLLAEAETVVAGRWSLGRARMTVIRQRPELIAWYVRHGYADTGERQPFPYGDPRFGEPQRDDLEFVILEKQLGASATVPATQSVEQE